MFTLTHLHAGLIAALAALALLVSAPALAQEREFDGTGFRTPELSYDYDGDREPYRGTRRGDARLFDPSVGFDLPTRAEQLARSREDLRLARQLIRQTERELRIVEREERELLQASPELQEARRELEQAREQLRRARRDAEREIEDHPVYEETAERLEELDQAIRAAHDNPATPRVELVELANQRLWYRERLNDLRDELGDREAIDEARAELRAAADRLQQAETEMERTLREVPEVAEARERHRQARAFYNNSRTEFVGARAAYFEADFRQVQQDRIRRQRPLHTGVLWRW